MGKTKWDGDVEVTFRSYLEEIERLVAIVDRARNLDAAAES